MSGSIEDHIDNVIFADNAGGFELDGREEEVLERLRADPQRAAQFRDAWPKAEGPMPWNAVVDALASFTRVIVSGQSPYDQYVYGGQDDALTPAERRGMALFFGERLECHHCHGGVTLGETSLHEKTKGAQGFHNIGLYNVDGTGAYPKVDPGVIAYTGWKTDMGRFRAPSLRNVALTAPYMHDGSVASLDDVVRLYENGGRVVAKGPYAGDGRANPFKSDLVTGFALTQEERADLLAFLHALTDEAMLDNPMYQAP